MKKTFAIVGLVGSLLAGATALHAQLPPEMPKPVKEHQWLQQFAGEWDAVSEMYMEPGKPPLKAKGTESVRKIGGFWTMSENKSTVMEMPMTGILTLGYDPEKKKFIGTWVDSMTSHMWTYEGKLDSTGKVLTLETEGPCPMSSSGMAKFKEVIDFKSKDHKVFSSSVQGDDGKWQTMLKIDYRRKK
jgi:hypothetical protein